MSKKIVAAEKVQRIPGPGRIREKIRDVRFVSDAAGNPVQSVAVRLDKTWHLLDATKLAQGHSDELVAIANRSRIALDIGASERRLLCDQILAAQERVLVRLEPSGYQTVHYEGEVKEVFVWRGEPHWVGTAPDFKWMIAPGIQPPLRKEKGSLYEWKDYAKSFRGNHYLVVGLGAALSALLAKPLGVDTLSLFYIGRSSIGKGAMQMAIKSIIDFPKLESSAGTDIGMHQKFSEFGGQPVLPDDLRQQKDTEALVSLLFDVGNGAGRNVGHASQSAITGKPLECLVIGSNERTIQEMLGGVKYDAGLEARLLELQISESIGVFHRLPKGFSDGRKFSEYLKAQAHECYGTVWNAWVKTAAKRLIDLRILWAEQKDELLDSLMDEGVEYDGLTQRVLKGVAFWKFCLLMAAYEELVPLKPKAIEESFEFVIDAHMEQRRAGMPKFSESIVDQIRGFIQSNPSKFPKLTESAMSRDRVWGFRHQVNDESLYLFYPNQLFKLIGQEVGRSTLVYALQTAGLLYANGEHGDRVIKMPDKTTVRMFAIRASILADG